MNRASLIARLGVLATACVALPTLLACLEHPLKPVEYEASQEEIGAIALSVNKDVDILFVIDNSGSMGEEQANLSDNFGVFVGVLEREGVEANYRIGITTTDNGNLWCRGAGVSDPEAGQFVLSSCRERLNDFLFTGDGTDAQTACTDNCELSTLSVVPTATKNDPELKVRPWLENIEGQSNLPDGVTTTQAMQCFGPQGINGCGFESHLESVWKTLQLVADVNQRQYDFVRDNAILAVVFVTDEADCSFNAAHEQAIFGADGDRTFWSLPDIQQAPTSAVCWNAGVDCTGDPGAGSYDACVSANKDALGNAVADNVALDAAVLWPVAKYDEFFTGLEASKQMVNPNQELLIAGIVGVGENYPATQQLVYAPGVGADDPTSFQARFGIGQGCSSAVGEAVPPVRLREFAETFQVGDDSNLFSVCSADYAPALEAIAKSIEDQLKPPCMPACVADGDEATELVEPSCTLEQTYFDGADFSDNVPRCEGGTPPDGADLCYVALTDLGGLTESTGDDMQQACIDAGWNLEFRIVRAQGVQAPAGAQISATCELSQNQDLDCPLLN